MTPEQVDKLATFGQMALEQGWYDQARDYFEQALALDASNREAMKGLAWVNEILSRREAVGIEAIRSEPVEQPPKPEILPTKQKAESPKQRFTKVTKRLARLFGTLAVLSGSLFVLPYAGVLLTIESGTGRTKYPFLLNLSIAGLLAAFLFGALWFACWALGKLWE